MRGLTSLALVGFLALPAVADTCPECPTPKPIPCERLKELKAKRCPPEAPEVKIVEHRVEVPVPGPVREVVREVQVPVPGPVVKEVVIQYQPDPKGHWLLGGGLLWHHDIGNDSTYGVQAVTGYRFPGGKWEILGGPTWTDRNDFHGTARKGCYSLPYQIHAANPWGATLLAVHAF